MPPKADFHESTAPPSAPVAGFAVKVVDRDAPSPPPLKAYSAPPEAETFNLLVVTVTALPDVNEIV
jgi:hypothetical protein